MAFSLLDSQKVLLTVTGVDAAGNPAPLDVATHPLNFVSSDTNIITLAAGTTPDSQFAVANGPLGTATVTATGGGVDAAGAPLTATFDLEVTAGGVVRLVITAGTPEAKA